MTATLQNLADIVHGACFLANTSFHLVFSPFFPYAKIVSTSSQKILELGYKHAVTIGHLDALNHKCRKARVFWLVSSGGLFCLLACLLLDCCLFVCLFVLC